MGIISGQKVLMMEARRQPNERSEIPEKYQIEGESDYIQEHEQFEEHRKRIIEELERETTKELNENLA